MPQIQEYLPQQAAQEPVGATSPNIELAGATGRSIENVGNAISEGGELLHRRSVQEEQSNLYADFADRRADQTQKLQSQIQDGSLDIEKFQDEYDQSTQDTFDKVSTPEGRNYFERQNARLRGQLLKTASVGQAQIAARNASADLIRARGQNSNAIMAEPSMFDDSMGAGIEDIDQRIKNGGLPEKMRGQAINEMGRDYAKAAIRGLSNDNPESAKLALDKGTFDEYLSGDQKHEMYSEVQRDARAQEVQAHSDKKKVDEAQKAAVDAWGQQALPKWVNNTLTAKEVLNNPDMKPEQKERWIKMIDQRSKEVAGKSDPKTFMNLANKISNGEIQDMQDLMPYVGHGVNTEGFNRLNTFIDKTHPEIKQGEKALFKSIQGVRYKNPMTGQWDSDGDQKAAQAMHDYADAKKNVVNQGGKPHDLVDPNSKFFFGTPENLAKYQTSMQDQMSSVSRDRTDKALDLKREGSDATADVPKPKNKNVRQPNESQAGFLKRINSGG